MAPDLLGALPNSQPSSTKDDACELSTIWQNTIGLRQSAIPRVLRAGRRGSSSNYSTAFLLAFAALTIGTALLAAASSLSRCVSFAVRAIAAVAWSNRDAKVELTALSDEAISALVFFRSDGSAKACAEPRDRRAKLMAIVLIDRFPLLWRGAPLLRRVCCRAAIKRAVIKITQRFRTLRKSTWGTRGQRRVAEVSTSPARTLVSATLNWRATGA